jgi:hypothetical protein
MPPPVTPGTLGAQFTDSRVATGAAQAPRSHTRAALMVLLIVFALLAGLATFLVGTGLRESPFGPPRDSVDPKHNATPPPHGAPLPPRPSSSARAAPRE